MTPGISSMTSSNIWMRSGMSKRPVDISPFEIPLPYYLKLTQEMLDAGDRAEARAREDGCASASVLKAVFFEAAVQVWLDDQYEKVGNG